jgi:hypothetical protein
VERGILYLKVISVKYRQYIRLRGDWDMLVEYNYIRIRYKMGMRLE